MNHEAERKRLYDMVRTGKVKFEDLNDQGKGELKVYLQSKYPDFMRGGAFLREEEGAANTNFVPKSFPVMASPKEKEGGTLGVLDKTMDVVDKTLGSVRRFTDRATATAVDKAIPFFDPLQSYDDRKKKNDPDYRGIFDPTGLPQGFDKTADVVGNIAGYFPGGVAAYATGGKLAANLFGKIAPNAPKLAKNLVRGTGAGFTFGVGGESIDAATDALKGREQDNLTDRLKRVGLETAIGGIGDAGLYGLGKGIKAISDKTGLTERLMRAIKGRPETLYLPPAQPKIPSGPTPPVIEMGASPLETKMPLALPAPKGTKAQIEQGENYYAQRFNELIDELKQRDLPPGREWEYAQEVWSQMARNEDPGLEQLIEMAKPTLEQITKRQNTLRDPELIQRVKKQQESKLKYGVPLPVRPIKEVFEGGQPFKKEIMKGVKPLKSLESLKDEPPLNISSRDTPLSEFAVKVQENPANVKLEKMDLKGFKDYSGFKFNTTDLYRNLRDVSGDQFPIVKETILDPFDQSKKEFVQMQENLVNQLKTNIVDRLGIKKGSKDSALVQMYGEGEITLDELKKRAPNNWQNIVKADQWFRQQYDGLLDKVNQVRSQIYPNNPEKIVPKRKDYYRHFRDFEGLAGLKNLFDTPAEIDPSLVGISEFTKPGSKFHGFMQKRGLGPFKRDAVGGFLEYIPGAAYATHIDPNINMFKDLAKYVANNTKGELNNFINYLQKFSQDLAGKTNAADRYFQENVPGGRMTMGTINWLNNRFKANVILGNVSSTLAQVANIPNGIAFAKQYSMPGAGRTLKAIFNPDEVMEKSGFLKERFSGKLYRQFDSKIIDQPKRFAAWAIETADRVGTTFIWNSAYSKALAEGVKNPVKYADEVTRSLVAGRGIGEVPLLQKSKLFQIVAPFQLEVANAWRVQKDFVKEKDFIALATFYLGAFLFNKAMEEIRGSGVVFDPIQAVVDASQEGLTPLERGGRLAGEVLSNVPLGQSLASIYPEYGGEILGKKLPTRKKLFGDKDPTRFGTGIPLVRGVQQPQYYLLPPFGGNQLRKTIDGSQAIRKEGDYVNNKLKFPVQRNPEGVTKALLFGPSATDEGKEYYDKDRRPLSERETEEYLRSKNPQQYYDKLMDQRLVNRYKQKIKEIQKDREMGVDEKKREIDKLIKKLREISK